MSEFISALILAIVQGITEWIPVSSSGHLVLVSKILGFNNNLMFDVALHFGTLMAVFIYFGKDITEIIRQLFSFNFKSEHGKLGLLLILATIPAAVLGFFFKDFIESNLANLGLLALGWSITGLILFIGSISKPKKKIVESKGISYTIAGLIGLAQVLSLFRGISRSGSTITAGLLLGLNEKMAVKFSFLMSIPIIFGASIVQIGNNALPSNLLWATLVSFAVGITTIHFSFNYFLSNRKNLRWFAFYVWLLAIGTGIYLLVN